MPLLKSTTVILLYRRTKHGVAAPYLSVDDACEDGVLLVQLQLQVDEGQLVGADLEPVVCKQDPREAAVALHRHRAVFTRPLAPLKPAESTKKTHLLYVSRYLKHQETTVITI